MNLKEIQKPVQNLLDQTNSIILQKIQNRIESLKRIGELTPLLKGKKIRSTLLFLLAGMSRLNSAILPEIAASIELFHLSSLIHDDIVDRSEKRRGEKTLNINLGNFRSVMWGDYIFINSFNSIHNLNNPRLMGIILNAARLMVEGQLIEIENAHNFQISLDTYYDIIQRKTSSLFAGTAEIVPTLKMDCHQDIKKYHQFGLNFGTIFQIADDMLDIFSKKSGKDRFNDLEEGKITLPIILLLEENKTDVPKYFLDRNHEALLKYCEKHNIQGGCLETISQYYHQCLDFLNSFPDSEHKQSLIYLLDFIKYREY